MWCAGIVQIVFYCIQLTFLAKIELCTSLHEIYVHLSQKFNSASGLDLFGLCPPSQIGKVQLLGKLRKF